MTQHLVVVRPSLNLAAKGDIISDGLMVGTIPKKARGNFVTRIALPSASKG
jgi:hypothetical protein